MNSPITTHVLDTARGRPAKGVGAVLSVDDGGGTWREIGRGTTNDDGRIADLLPPGSLGAGTYRMRFDTGAYFEALGTSGFYPWVEIVFAIDDTRAHYHVPLLLSPFGYSTYRGS